MPYKAQNILKIEHTFQDPGQSDVGASKTEVYENEQTTSVYELDLAHRTVRKLQAGESINPPTGGNITTYIIHSKDGTEVSVALDWAVFIDGKMEYILLS